MPNWYKGQHGRVSKVLKHPFADVLYPAPTVAQRAVHFVAKSEMMVSHTRSQLFNAPFQFLPSGGADCQSPANIILATIIPFWRSRSIFNLAKQMQ